MNISDRHLVDRQNNKNATSDVHFQLQGPVVGQLALEFERAWELVTGRLIGRQPIINSPYRGAVSRTLTDGPDEVLDRLPLLLGAAIAGARHSIRIMTPYVLPRLDVIGAL